MADFRPLRAIVKKEQKRLWNSCPELGLQALWEQAAGPDIALHASVRSLRDGILTVGCDSGAWACELGFHVETLTAKLNRLNPPEQVREIRFTHGVRGGGKSRK